MEHITRIFQHYPAQIFNSCTKQFDECSWKVKVPALFVGAYIFTKSCDGLFSWLFGNKMAMQADVQQLFTEVENLKALNPDELDIKELTVSVMTVKNFLDQELDGKKLSKTLRNMKVKIKDLNSFATMTRSIVLGQINRSKKGNKSLKGIDEKIELILKNAEISPRKRHSWGEISPRSFSSDPRNKGKEKELKRKKKKTKKVLRLSSLDKFYEGKGTITPRDDFFSDTERSISPESKFLENGDGEK